MLTQGDDAKAAVKTLQRAPAFMDILRQRSMELKAALEPSDRERVTLLLIQQAIVFGVPDRSQEEWGTLFGIYHQTLGEFSEAILAEAFARWNRAELYPKEPGRHAFFPKPAELHALASAYKRDLYQAMGRAKSALAGPTERAEIWTRERKAEERRKAIEMGVLNADGSFNWNVRPKTMPGSDEAVI